MNEAKARLDFTGDSPTVKVTVRTVDTTANLKRFDSWNVILTKPKSTKSQRRGNGSNDTMTVVASPFFSTVPSGPSVLSPERQPVEQRRRHGWYSEPSGPNSNGLVERISIHPPFDRNLENPGDMTLFRRNSSHYISQKKALEILRKGRGIQFDANLFDLFMENLSEIGRVAKANLDDPTEARTTISGNTLPPIESLIQVPAPVNIALP